MVFAFLKTCYSLQSVTSERRFGCVNMVRSQVKQFNIFGLTGKYFNSTLYKGNGVKTKDDDRDPARWQDVAIQMLTCPHLRSC